MMKMRFTKDHLDAIGRIKFLAADKRHRVLLEDENEWLETKMKEIRKQCRRLPGDKWKPASKARD